MANFIITYDLNGPRPTHKQMDDHLLALGPKFVRGRLLETVWYLAGPTTAVQIRNYIQPLLSANDLLLVVEATSAAWTDLLVNQDQFKATFEAQPLRVAA